MIYYLDTIVNWQNPSSPQEKEVAEGIEAIREKYFGQGKPNFVELEDPRGKRKKNVTGFYEPRKIFTIDYVGGQGEWRFTGTRPNVGAGGQLSYNDSSRLMTNNLILREDEIEFIWFMLNKNNQIKKGKNNIGRLKVVDHELEATVANETIADDIDLRFHLFSKSSPIANDVKLLKEIAVTLNVPDVDSIGVQQLKNRLYDFITKGNKQGNKFVNTEVFMELTSADDKRKIAFSVSNAVNKGDLKYSTKDFQWHFVEAGKLGDPILYVAGKDANMATTILINQCITDAKFRASIYGYLGLEEKTQLDIFREMTRKELMSKCDELDVSYRDNEKKEDLVEKVCEKLGVEYKPI